MLTNVGFATTSGVGVQLYHFVIQCMLGSFLHERSQPATGWRYFLRSSRSRNATKHGIFSATAVGPGEDQTEFDRLRRELYRDVKPEGKLQEIQVEKLAALFWALKRVFRGLALEGSFKDGLDISLTETPKLEVLLRYLTTLDKTIEKAVAEIARLKQIRTGQPVPTLHLNVSS